MSRRTERVNELLREELADLLLRESKDPRLSEGMLSVTGVRVTGDLSRASVYVSHLGTADERAHAVEALRRAKPFLQRALGGRLRSMRRVPELHFELDPSLERGAHLTALMRDTAADRPVDPDR